MMAFIRIAAALERIAHVLESQVPAAEACPLVSAIIAEFRGSTFTAREVMERSERLASEAEMRGQRMPDLPHELTRAKITTTHALGRWLADSPNIEKVSAENGSAVWAVVSDVANILATMPQDFPQMSPRSGLILNVPALVTDALEPGRIVLMDSLGFAVNQGLVTIARSNAAALKLDDEPVMDSTTPTPSGELISLFQSNLTAIRIMAGIGIKRIRDNAVAVLDGVHDGERRQSDKENGS